MKEKEDEMQRLPFQKRFTVSLKALLVILLVLFGMVPMLLCTQTVISSLRQSQTDSRMIEVQNQCQILSSKMTRTGYLKGEDKAGLLDSEIETMADVYNGRIVVVNQDFRVVRDTFHIAENRILVAEEVINCFWERAAANTIRKSIILPRPFRFMIPRKIRESREFCW